jgi:hypothetical protein
MLGQCSLNLFLIFVPHRRGSPRGVLHTPTVSPEVMESLAGLKFQ